MKSHFSLFVVSSLLFSTSLTACGSTPSQPSNPSASPSPSASPQTTATASGRVYTEAEVEAGITCFEASENVLAKASGGQLRFGFENNKRGKTLLGASAYQDYLNTTGEAMLKLQNMSTDINCIK